MTASLGDGCTLTVNRGEAIKLFPVYTVTWGSFTPEDEPVGYANFAHDAAIIVGRILNRGDYCANDVTLRSTIKKNGVSMAWFLV
jgi:hypothetical protein